MVYLALAPGSVGHFCPAFARAHASVCCARQALQRPCRGASFRAVGDEFVLLTLN
jgi:hypothetical protein